MEPRIQYAQTKDGVSIAYWTLGEGTPLLVTSSAPLSPSLRSWQDPPARAYWEKLARDRLLIRYDHRGCGNSQHDISDQSFDTLVTDLEAVADQAGLEEFALCGSYWCAPFAIAYTVRHPGRITKLILFDASARGSDFFNQDRLRKARESEDDDPEFFLQILAHEALGWTGAELAQSLISDTLKEVDPRVLRMTMDTVVEADVTDLLAQVAAPTLVLHRRNIRYPRLDAARTLAAGIPGAQLLVLEGGDPVGSYFGDTDAVASAIDEFLGEGEESPGTVEPSETGAFRTILFTDVEASAEITQRLGDARAREVMRTHERIVREALESHGGAEVKTLGDGFMASFSSATKALECAIATQRAFAAHNESAAEPIQVRIGLNAGEPIAEDDDLFGTAVITAARIAAKAQGGEILASDVVRQLVAGKDFLFSDRGDAALRGFEDPVRLYDVRWQEDAGGG